MRPLTLVHTLTSFPCPRSDTAKLTLGNAGIRPFTFFNESDFIAPESGAIPEQEPSRNSSALFGVTFTHVPSQLEN